MKSNKTRQPKKKGKLTMKMNDIEELKNVLISQAMNDEDRHLVICDWVEIQEFGFYDFNPEDDADVLILSLYHDERVLEVWEREISNEPVLTIYV